MGGRELPNRKSMFRTALLKNEFRTLAVRAFKALRCRPFEPLSNTVVRPPLTGAFAQLYIACAAPGKKGQSERRHHNETPERPSK